MNLTTLANLIAVRDYLQIVVNNRSVVPKEDYRYLTSFVGEIDKKILDGIKDINLDNVGDNETKTETVIVPVSDITYSETFSKNNSPDSKQLVLPLNSDVSKPKSKTKTKKTTKKTNPAKEPDDIAEINKRIAEEKKKVGVNKKGFIKRADD